MIFFSYAAMQWKDFRYKLEHGESLQEVQERNVAVVKTLLTQHEGATILIATHGTALGTIYNYYEKRFDFERFLKMVDKMPWIVRMTFEKHTLTSIEEIPLSLN